VGEKESVAPPGGGKLLPPPGGAKKFFSAFGRIFLAPPTHKIIAAPLGLLFSFSSGTLGNVN
jgi:hypothetical protein